MTGTSYPEAEVMVVELQARKLTSQWLQFKTVFLQFPVEFVPTENKYFSWKLRKYPALFVTAKESILSQQIIPKLSLCLNLPRA